MPVATGLITTRPDCRLFGREATLANVAADIERGRTLFALEGVTGIGKSALIGEVMTCLGVAGFNGFATLNAAQHTSEDLAIAAVYVQLKETACDPELLGARVREKFGARLPGTLRKLGAAIAADIITQVVDKAEKTAEAIQGIIGEQDLTPSVVSQLEELDRDNLRFFFSQFLEAIAAAKNKAVIAIDNFDCADDSLVKLVRFLIAQKPREIALVIAHNTENGENADWDYVLADLRARSGCLLQIGPLDQVAMGDWFTTEVGRSPTQTELDSLQDATGGRALEIKIAIEAMKLGGAPPLHGDYVGYYECARRQLSRDARTVAELLAVINRDALVSEDLLAAAAEVLGVGDLGSALDELHARRLLKREGGEFSLSHSSVRSAWLQWINERRRLQLGEAWYAAVRDFALPKLAEPGVVGLLPVITTSLFERMPAADVAEFGEQLIAMGQIRTGLQMLDRAWEFKVGVSGGGEQMLRHALIAARTRLDLGRYREVDEPLKHAELAAVDETGARVQVLLLRMKLALRRNAYAALEALAGQLAVEEEADSKDLVEGELILNTAYRDRLGLNDLRASCRKLQVLYHESTPKLQNAIDRALARSLAKLGDTDPALEHALRALATSSEAGSIRVVGNANLAVGEVRRYRGEFNEAIRAYRDAADIARASGNRDSLLWSLLGEAAAHIEARAPGEVMSPLSEVSALLVEPGYEHPLETAHAMLLRALAGVEKITVEQLAEAYRPFQIEWPVQRFSDFLMSGKISGVTPL